MSGSPTPKAALYTALLGSQVPKWPMEVTECGQGMIRRAVALFVGITGWVFIMVCSYQVDSVGEVGVSHQMRPFSRSQV